MKKKRMGAALAFFAFVSMGAVAQEAQSIQKTALTMPVDGGRQWTGRYTQFVVAPVAGESPQALAEKLAKSLAANVFGTSPEGWVGKAPSQTEAQEAAAMSQVGRLSMVSSAQQVLQEADSMRFFSETTSNYLVSIQCPVGANGHESEECVQRRDSLQSRREQSLSISARFLPSGGVLLSWRRHETEGNPIEHSERTNQSRMSIASNNSLVFAETHGGEVRVSIFTPSLLEEQKEAKAEQPGQ